MEQTKQKSRNNHYVPQFYLRQWSNNGNSVYCYDTIVRNAGQRLWRSTSIKSIACWKDFYSQNQNGEIDDSIELFIERHYETPAKACLKKLGDGTDLCDDELACIVDFAILQMVRTPAWYNKTNSITEEIFLDTMKESIQSTLDDYRAGRLDKLTRYDKYAETRKQDPFPNTPIETIISKEKGGIVSTISIGRRNYLSSMGQTLNGELAERLRKYDWSILEMPMGYELPTSDNPFTRLAYRGRHDYDFDGGLGVPKVDLFMPLSPKHLLFTEVESNSKPNPYLLWSENARSLIIRSIIGNASRYIFNRTIDQAIVDMRPRVIDPDYDDKMRNNLMHWDELQP